MTSFIGREGEIEALLAALAPARPDAAPALITLCGPGGSGKTRLALETAARAAAAFDGGVAMIDLSRGQAPELLPAALAQAFGLPEQPGVSPLAALRAALGGLRCLLVLDNCEAVAAPAGALALALLSAAPGLRILATSQTPLGVAGEMLWQVEPFAVPGVEESTAASPAADGAPTPCCDAVRLFVERGQAVERDFALTRDNADAVARICRRLDGLPLAIELAAARVRLLTPAQIADRLDDVFRLLPGRDHCGCRYDSLAAAIGWSWGLLSAGEQAALRRLAVFRGGFTLEAAERVCAGGEIAAGEILSLLGQLADRSLITPASPERSVLPRYHLLEIVRQYAAGRLTAAAEEAAIRSAHLDYYRARAEAVQEALGGPDQVAALRLVEAEADNHREALAWGLAGAGRDLENALRLAAALAEFWHRRDRFGEGRRWLAQAVAAAAGAGPGLRARLYSGAGTMAWLAGDYAQAEAWHRISLDAAQRAGDRAAEALARNHLATVDCYLDRLTLAAEGFAQAMAIFGELADPRGVATVLIGECLVAILRGDYAAALARAEAALHPWRRLGDTYYLALVLHNLGDLARLQGDFARAAVFLEESMALCRELGNRRLLVLSLTVLARIDLQRGDRAAAQAGLRQCLGLCRELGDQRGIAEQLEGLALVAAAAGEWSRATRLLAAATGLLANLATTLWLFDLPEHLAALEDARSALGPGEFEAEWATGGAMSIERVFELAMADRC